MYEIRPHVIVYFLLVFLCIVLTACVGPTQKKLVDLTYPFDEHTVYWPNNKPFQWEKTKWGVSTGGYWYASASFSASEHGGTHLDAPIHFAELGRSVDEIPLDQLTGPAVVIDLRERCKENADYEVQIEDVRAWETEHGQIPEKTLVLILTGWGAYWPDKSRYLGTTTLDDPTTMHFPGYSAKVVDFLVVQRGIRGIGIDTASIDPGQSRDFQAHRILNGANLYALENVAELDQLPPKGAIVTALPIKTRGGTGGPVRIMATVP